MRHIDCEGAIFHPIQQWSWAAMTMMMGMMIITFIMIGVLQIAFQNNHMLTVAVIRFHRLHDPAKACAEDEEAVKETRHTAKQCELSCSVNKILDMNPSLEISVSSAGTYQKIR